MRPRRSGRGWDRDRCHQRSALAAVVLVLLVITGCRDASVDNRTEPSAPRTSEALALAIDTTPLVTIGRAPESGDYVFQNVGKGGIVHDSLVVVIDDGVVRAGIYGFDGRFRRWVISKGEGPGEIMTITDAGVSPRGWVWAYALPEQRIIAVDHRGEVVSEVRLPIEEPRDVFRMEVIGPGADGAWWFRRDHDVRGAHETLVRVPTDIIRLTPDGSTDIVWSGDGDLSFQLGRVVTEEGRTMEAAPIRSAELSRLLLAVHGAGVLMAWTDSSFVDLLGPDGGLTRVGSFASRRAPVPPQERPAGAPRGTEAFYQLERYFPEIANLLVDVEGGIWALQPPADTAGRGVLSIYRLSGEGPTAVLQSSVLRKFASPLGSRWALLERRDPDTEEEYVTLHRLSPRDSIGEN